MDDETSWPSHAVLPRLSQKVPYIQVMLYMLYRYIEHLANGLEAVVDIQALHKCYS
jgi:hypothetical protein